VAIAQDLLLGRLPPDSQISSDRGAWTQATDVDTFSRLPLPGRADPGAGEHGAALRRWADQRCCQDRRASGPRPGPDRRRAHGGRRTVSLPRQPGASIAQGWAAVASLLVVILGLALAAAVLGHAPPIRLLQ
jgi:hypothetical protein